MGYLAFLVFLAKLGALDSRLAESKSLVLWALDSSILESKLLDSKALDFNPLQPSPPESKTPESNPPKSSSPKSPFPPALFCAFGIRFADFLGVGRRFARVFFIDF